MTRRILALTTALTLLAAPAFAVPATQDGADRIVQAFKTYFGPASDIAKVSPQGDTYALVVDASPLFLLGQAEGVTGTASPLTLTLTDNGDGTWAVTMDQAVSITAKVPDVLDLTETVDQLAFQGTFDEALMSFTTASGTMKGVKVDETIQSPNQPATHATIAMNDGTFSTTARANPAGGVDSDFSATINGLTEQMESPLDGGDTAIPLLIKAETVSESGTVTGFKVQEVMAALAWAVAHPDPDAMFAARAEAKPLAQVALPVFTHLEAVATASMLSVDTPMGMFGLQEASGLVALNGLTSDGLGREGFTLTGLTLPPGLVPDWAMPMLPAKASLDVQVSGFDAAAMAQTLLSVLDLPDGQDPAPSFEDDVLASLMPQGVVTIGLNPGAVEGEGYKLTYEGSMEVGPETEIPTGSAKVTLTGIQVLLDGMNAAPDDMKMQAMMGLGAMRGLAKPGEDGALVWEVDATTPGVVLVNGMDLSTFGGAP